MKGTLHCVRLTKRCRPRTVPRHEASEPSSPHHIVAQVRFIIESSCSPGRAVAAAEPAWAALGDDLLCDWYDVDLDRVHLEVLVSR